MNGWWSFRRLLLVAGDVSFKDGCPCVIQKPSRSVCAFGLTSWDFMVRISPYKN